MYIILSKIGGDWRLAYLGGVPCIFKGYAETEEVIGRLRRSLPNQHFEIGEVRLVGQEKEQDILSLPARLVTIERDMQRLAEKVDRIGEL